MALLTTILSGFALAALAPLVHLLARRWTGAVLTLLPATLFGWFILQWGPISRGQVLLEQADWVPQLSVRLSLRLDGLGLVFALLITGVGALVTLYAGRYLKGHPQLGRFYLFLLSFMASMLGLVLSDNLLALFVFWEITSLTSYLLIGFEHETESARAAALQGLLVTVAGGQALLIGLVLLDLVAGTLELSRLPALGELARAHPLYPAILLLVLAGAFTKSAQFPFHFWLPAAMAAPTPVSAYLHSATMVKAGVYLLARLSPTLGGTSLWWGCLVGIGGLSALVAGALALGERDLKRILAYATVSILGILTLLIGLGTALALQAALVFLLAHALYKGALFLVAGTVDHATGTREVTRLSGLGKALPLSAAATALAALSMAGLFPLFGFVAKELVYEAVLEASPGAATTSAATVVSFACLVAVGAVCLRPFLGPPAPLARSPHEAPIAMWLPPLLLSLLGPVLGLAPALVEPLLSAAARPLHPEAPLKLVPWHGFTPALALSALSLGLGAALFSTSGALRRILAKAQLGRWGPGRAYELGLTAMLAFAGWQIRVIQSGRLRHYVRATVCAIGALVLAALGFWAESWPRLPLEELRAHELGVAAVMLLAALAAVRSRSRLQAVVAMGVVGFGVALVFLFFGAPDLALTQAIVESLTIVIFLLALFHLPRYQRLSSGRARAGDLLISLGVGALMTTLVLLATQQQGPAPISGFFLEQSVPLAHGRNVVNVILVEFRALDTLGEITVLAVAALGVLGLLRLGRRPRVAR